MRRGHKRPPGAKKNPWLELYKQKYLEVIQEGKLKGKEAIKEACRRAKDVYKPIKKKKEDDTGTGISQSPGSGWPEEKVEEGRGPVIIV